MKKTFVSVLLIAIITISGYIGYDGYQLKNANLCLDECEALAGCEVYDSNHNIIAKCEGEEGVCYKLTANFYCSGKKVIND